MDGKNCLALRGLYVDPSDRGGDPTMNTIAIMIGVYFLARWIYGLGGSRNIDTVLDGRLDTLSQPVAKLWIRSGEL